MTELKEKARLILNIIEKSDKILIISHRNPDPDTTGSNIALRHFLLSKGITSSSACIDPMPEKLKALAGYMDFITDFDPKNYDLFISVDCGSADQISFNKYHKSILGRKLINIDHHPNNEIPSILSLTDPTAASASIIIFELLTAWNAQITPQMATWLLFGIYFDTGSFMHSNTNDQVYRIAAALLQKGANQREITRLLYRNQTIEKLHLWGRALSNLKKNRSNTVITGLTPKDFTDCNATKDDASGLIDYLGAINGSDYATFLCSDPQHNQVRGSLRTRHDNVDVSAVAKQLGGGGHRKASGFAIDGTLKREMHWTITNE